MPARKAQRYDDSSSDDSSDSSEDISPPPKKKKAPAEKKPPAEKAPQIRLATGKRLEIISMKERGIEDPEYSCSKTTTGKWIVKRRKMPLDQSPHLDTTAGTMKIPDLQRVPTKEIPKEEIPQEKPKKDDLQLSWINMQATVNDSLKRDLVSLSEKYERLAQKEERRKKEKAKAPPPPKQIPQQIPPQIPPQYQAPVPQQVRSQPQLRTGQYARAKPISLNQF
jgi:hypothetical protein